MPESRVFIWRVPVYFQWQLLDFAQCHSEVAVAFGYSAGLIRRGFVTSLIIGT